MIITEAPVEGIKEYLSVSRLKTLSVCSMSYKLKYVDKLKSKNFSVSTMIGNICHDALEVYHVLGRTTPLLELLEQTAKKTILERKFISNTIPGLNFDRWYADLIKYGKSLIGLYERAGADYQGSAPIRKKDGGIASSPTSTTDWKEAERGLGLTSLRDRIDQTALSFNAELEEVSFANVISEAFAICNKYVCPPEVGKTVATEFPVSDMRSKENTIINAVLMPHEYGGEDGVFLNSYIDWIGYVTVNGKEGLAIVDYKTSKEELQEDLVEYNAQLLSYVYAYEYLTGAVVDYIGIHNLRAGSLAMAPVNREVMAGVLESLFFKYKLIKQESFYKHVPDTSYSPCLNQFGKVCPYLGECWPQYTAPMKQERKPFKPKTVTPSTANHWEDELVALGLQLGVL